MKRKFLLGIIGVGILTAVVVDPIRSQPPQPAAAPVPEWRAALARKLPAYGHRNWIVIADSAFPLQTKAGIETVVTGAGQLDVVRAIYEELGKTKHVQPVAYLDAELALVGERDAPGISQYREDLKKLLTGKKPQPFPHEELINSLDKTAEKFHVLVLKTDMVLPYTTVFLELDCKYWSAEAEGRLRDRMPEGK